MNAMFPLKVFVLVWLIVALVVASVAAKEKPAENEEVEFARVVDADHLGIAAEELKNAEAWSRLREGSKIIDELGEFQITANRFSFSAQDGKRMIQVLENLSLERVARTLEDDPSPRIWSVSGTITEFRGENYLLITRAVLKPRQPSRLTKAKTETKDGKDQKDATDATDATDASDHSS